VKYAESAMLGITSILEDGLLLIEVSIYTTVLKVIIIPLNTGYVALVRGLWVMLICDSQVINARVIEEYGQDERRGTKRTYQHDTRLLQEVFGFV
tara:strand:- start:44 stop:328 length:285 start_codon:yes stop_codon:yes gene_type:complete